MHYNLSTLFANQTLSSLPCKNHCMLEKQPVKFLQRERALQSVEREIKRLNYLQRNISKASSSLSTTYTNDLFLTTPTDNVVPSIHIIRTCIILSTSCWSNIEFHVEPSIYSQKLLNLQHLPIRFCMQMLE